MLDLPHIPGVSDTCEHQKITVGLFWRSDVYFIYVTSILMIVVIHAWYSIHVQHKRTDECYFIDIHTKYSNMPIDYHNDLFSAFSNFFFSIAPAHGIDDTVAILRPISEVFCVN